MINKITFVIMVFLILSATAYAWHAPVLTSKCAPSSTKNAFDITLTPEADQNIDLSYDNFLTLIETKDFVVDGTHSFTEAIGGPTLYARYASDHGASGSVSVDRTLCTPVTPPVTPPSGSHPGPSGSMVFPCHYFPGATEDCQTTPEQQNLWNNPYTRERIMDEWRCNTFGTDCIETPKVDTTTPAYKYGK